VHLDYNATMANNTRVLDDMESIDRVECLKSGVNIYLSVGYNASVRVIAESFNGRWAVHGGPEWGCTDKNGKAVPFYYEIIKSMVMTDGGISLQGSSCSPFVCFKKLKMSIWSERPPSALESSRDSSINLMTNASSGIHKQSRMGYENTFRPGPIAFEKDLMKDLGLGNFGSLVASASYSYSPMTFHWDIDVSMGFTGPYIKANNMWLDLTQSFDFSMALNIPLLWRYSKQFSILPETPIPGMAIVFNVAAVSFDLGLFGLVDGKLQAELDAGPIAIRAGLTISRKDKVGFSYTADAGFSSIADMGSDEYTPHQSISLPSKLSGSLQLTVTPGVALTLGGSFFSYRESFSIKVRRASHK
jgi:hypothetical protein